MKRRKVTNVLSEDVGSCSRILIYFWITPAAMKINNIDEESEEEIYQEQNSEDELPEANVVEDESEFEEENLEEAIESLRESFEEKLEAINNLADRRRKVKFKKPFKKKSINKIELKCDEQNGPSIYIEKIGQAFLDSGSEISFISSERIPVQCKIFNKIFVTDYR